MPLDDHKLPHGQSFRCRCGEDFTLAGVDKDLQSRDTDPGMQTRGIPRVGDDIKSSQVWTCILNEKLECRCESICTGRRWRAIAATCWVWVAPPCSGGSSLAPSTFGRGHDRAFHIRDGVSPQLRGSKRALASLFGSPPCTP